MAKEEHHPLVEGQDVDSDDDLHLQQAQTPVLRDIQMRYAPVDFNGSFMNENIYRQVGSPEVDAAWEALGVDCAISYEDGLASGLDESYAQRSPQYGGGFIVNVEGMHHLHCLNLVRKALYFNYDHYRELGHHAFKNDEYILRLHVTHCLDTIRQVLMCNVDTGVLGQVWVDPEKPNAFPDFNTRHMCKDYDAVRRWAKDLQAPPLEDVPGDFLAPPIYGGVMPNTP
uniref:Tat pathway signal sequence n=1 Tax=Bionectria ochroleuca TaxID=29856 RepID=A0A0B7JPQ2_BIOOC